MESDVEMSKNKRGSADFMSSSAGISMVFTQSPRLTNRSAHGSFVISAYEDMQKERNSGIPA